MLNKVRFYRFPDISPILKSITLVSSFSLLMTLMFTYPVIVEEIKESKHDSEVNGVLVEVDSLTTIDQSLTGSQEKAHQYQVTYCYEVDGIPYAGADLVIARNTTIYKLNEILHSPDKRIMVKYSKNLPSISAVSLGLN